MDTSQGPIPPMLPKEAGPSKTSPEARVPRGQGAANSAFFNKLNYDVRAIIYANITPVLTLDHCWIGFSLSCSQAYTELAEIAAVAIKKFIQTSLKQCHEESAFTPRLLDDRLIEEGIAPLREIKIGIPLAAIDNPLELPYYTAYDPRSSDSPWKGFRIFGMFREDPVIFGLRDLFTKSFFKITLQIQGVKDPTLPRAINTFDDMNIFFQKFKFARARIAHVMETLHMLNGNPKHPLHEVFWPLNVRKNVLRPNGYTVRTRCIAVAWDMEARPCLLQNHITLAFPYHHSHHLIRTYTKQHGERWMRRFVSSHRHLRHSLAFSYEYAINLDGTWRLDEWSVLHFNQPVGSMAPRTLWP